MGAGPSTLQGHEKVLATDIVGDEFPSGASFFLTNGASDFKHCLAVELNGNSKCKALKDSPDRKWIAEYAGNDRSKIAFKNVGTGKYLCIANAAWSSQTMAYGGPVYLYIYKTAKDNTFWLSTPQSPDCFLCAWDNVPDIGKDVCNFTTRHGKGYGKGVEFYNENNAALSWQLEWTPEYQKLKEATPEGQAASEKRKAVALQEPKAEQGVCCDKCGDKCQVYQEAFAELEQFKGQYGDCKTAMAELHDRETQLEQAQQDAQYKDVAQKSQFKELLEREAELEKKQNEQKEREKDLARKEVAIKQQEIEMQKRDQDLDARKNAVLKDEARARPAQADKAAIKKRQDEQAAHAKEVQKKSEQVQQARQKEQAELAKVKAENAKLQDSVSKLKKKDAQSSGDSQGSANPAADMEKARLQADLQHALDMLAEMQQKVDQKPAPAVSSASYGFSIPPPVARMPPSTLGRPLTRMPEFTTSPPAQQMPEFVMKHQIEQPKNTLPQMLATGLGRSVAKRETAQAS
ncbi:hypothetical protein LTR78_003861 [Recurvomyces mirabilis]|uniref:Uncharacterized protein n=1 Tax=Recurvomyces mirabilis TaxID=574656 RepID=A0AAE0WQR9_9PEZI|nr:hypothetical protein LTR78_003861 [Recurvomyces mirabilis]KAK5154000.1 hypothetical protein LTS14_007220 [Recurvomyces mirabilis]